MAAIDRLRFRQREKRSEQLVNRHRVTYQQQAYEDTFVTSFLQRPDVAPALPYFSRRRKISLEREAVMARDGNSHSYLMLRQGKKRFLFAEEEIPINVTSDEERAKQLSFTLAVPQQIMRDEDLLPQAGHVFKRFRNRREVRRTLRTIGKNAYWMMRGNPEDPRSLENNTDFIQSIPSLVVHDH